MKPDELDDREIMEMTLRRINTAKLLVHIFLHADPTRYDTRKGPLMQRLDAALRRNRMRYYRKLGINDDFFSGKTNF